MSPAKNFEGTYNQNTKFYESLNKEEKKVLELHGKMDHSLREYQRETYVYAILNIVTIITAISAYKYLSSVNK